ncbi:MAG: DUF542 domain-containing protein [Chitinophagaceae bacterium]|nr:DUF542 domain-containing protein [Chitinophagaceae bacterium]
MIMSLTPTIDRNQTVYDIVNNDYRTADVFSKYKIEYCCGARFPLHIVCSMRGIDETALINELEEAVSEHSLCRKPDYSEWSVDFLTDYIINIHHNYLRKSLPVVSENLKQFDEEHPGRFHYMNDLKHLFHKLEKILISHIVEEEEIIFPYLRNISHAYNSKDSYAGLLVRTLRKPLKQIIHQTHREVFGILDNLRGLTNRYTPPSQTCLSHKVFFYKLSELDKDLNQHFFMENKILLPKVISMEDELLASNK